MGGLLWNTEKLSLRGKYAILAICVPAMICINLVMMWAYGLPRALVVMSLVDIVFLVALVMHIRDIQRHKKRLQST